MNIRFNTKLEEVSVVLVRLKGLENFLKSLVVEFFQIQNLVVRGKLSSMVSLRAISRSQRPRAGIFRSPYADLKIGARKGRDLKISTSRVSNNLWNAK